GIKFHFAAIRQDQVNESGGLVKWLKPLAHTERAAEVRIGLRGREGHLPAIWKIDRVRTGIKRGIYAGGRIFQCPLVRMAPRARVPKPVAIAAARIGSASERQPVRSDCVCDRDIS